MLIGPHEITFDHSSRLSLHGPQGPVDLIHPGPRWNTSRIPPHPGEPDLVYFEFMSHTSHLVGTQLVPDVTTVRVFGSNLPGRHGKVTAEVIVRRYGAKTRCGVGFAGTSFARFTKSPPLPRLVKRRP